MGAMDRAGQGPEVLLASSDEEAHLAAAWRSPSPDSAELFSGLEEGGGWGRAEENAAEAASWRVKKERPSGPGLGGHQTGEERRAVKRARLQAPPLAPKAEDPEPDPVGPDFEPKEELDPAQVPAGSRGYPEGSTSTQKRRLRRTRPRVQEGDQAGEAGPGVQQPWPGPIRAFDPGAPARALPVPPEPSRARSRSRRGRDGHRNRSEWAPDGTASHSWDPKSLAKAATTLLRGTCRGPYEVPGHRPGAPVRVSVLAQALQASVGMVLSCLDGVHGAGRHGKRTSSFVGESGEVEVRAVYVPRWAR